MKLIWQPRQLIYLFKLREEDSMFPDPACSGIAVQWSTAGGVGGGGVGAGVGRAARHQPGQRHPRGGGAGACTVLYSMVQCVVQNIPWEPGPGRGEPGLDT